MKTLIDTSRLKRIAGQIGSNPAGIYQDNKGQRYYVKNLESPMHARNELIAARLYQLVGAPTLTYLNSVDPCQVVTEWLVLDKKHIAYFSEIERKQAQHWFGVHAWTANWDAAGFDGDNQGVADGKVLTLDVGGALAFRAHGDPKGRAFGTEVKEISVMRSDRDNPHALKLFADMTAEEVREAIRVVTQIPGQQISQAIISSGGSQKLAEKMLARKEDMTVQLGGG